MIALLLIAGQSKRFWPLADKPLFGICGKALLAHQVERLKAGGIGTIVIVGGKHNLKAARLLFPKLAAVEQRDLSLGMRGALLSALPKCKDEPVLVVGGNDVIEPAAYRALLDRMQSSPALDGVILAQRVKRYFPGGYLTLKGRRVTGIVEKPGEGKEPSKFVNIVAHAHRSAKTLLNALKGVHSDRDDAYERVLSQLFQDRRYEAVPYDGVWQPVKYPWHLLSLLPIALGEITEQSLHPTAEIHPSAVIIGPVLLQKNVRILPHATVVGPCFVGEGSVIANNALVRQASIGRHCVVGYTTEIVRSILLDHVWTHSSYVGDAVIGNNTALGGGTMLGNLRLDEGEISSVVEGQAISTGLTKFGAIIGSDCRIGINCSLLPGVKIGSGSFVSAATLVDQDVPDNTFVKMAATKMVARPNRSPSSKPAEREKFRRMSGLHNTAA